MAWPTSTSARDSGAGRRDLRPAGRSLSDPPAGRDGLSLADHAPGSSEARTALRTGAISRRRADRRPACPASRRRRSSSAGRSSLCGRQAERPRSRAQGRERAHFRDEEGRRDSCYIGSRDDVLRWYQGCLVLEKKLSAFGPLYSQDPAIQFCVQSARRAARQTRGRRRDGIATSPPPPRPAPGGDAPWPNCGWPTAQVRPPKPVLPCAPADSRPYLDGKLDDPCWARRAAGSPAKRRRRHPVALPTEVRMAHDSEFLYFAVRCGHPAGEARGGREGADPRRDLRAQRPSQHPAGRGPRLRHLLPLQVDQRGCVLEDCWGDKRGTRNGSWPSTARRRRGRSEIAIPRNALTGDHITSGNAWAANVVRVLPGQGVQALLAARRGARDGGASGRPGAAPVRAERPAGGRGGEELSAAVSTPGAAVSARQAQRGNRKRRGLQEEGITAEACPALVRNAFACGFRVRFLFVSRRGYTVRGRLSRSPGRSITIVLQRSSCEASGPCNPAPGPPLGGGLPPENA